MAFREYEWESFWPAAALLGIAALAYAAQLLDYLMLPGEWK